MAPKDGGARKKEGGGGGRRNMDIRSFLKASHSQGGAGEGPSHASSPLGVTRKKVASLAEVHKMAEAAPPVQDPDSEWRKEVPRSSDKQATAAKRTTPAKRPIADVHKTSPDKENKAAKRTTPAKRPIADVLKTSPKAPSLAKNKKQETATTNLPAASPPSAQTTKLSTHQQQQQQQLPPAPPPQQPQAPPPQQQPRVVAVESPAVADAVMTSSQNTEQDEKAATEEEVEDPADALEAALRGYDPQKCTSFTEVPAFEVSPRRAVGKRVQVIFDENLDSEAWYGGTVTSHDDETGMTTFQYDDGERETVALSELRVRYNLAPSESLADAMDAEDGALAYAPWCTEPLRIGVGEVVWQTIRGYPTWPARVVAPADALTFDVDHVTKLAEAALDSLDCFREGKAPSPFPLLVQFFGTHDWGIVRSAKELLDTRTCVEEKSLHRPKAAKGKKGGKPKRTGGAPFENAIKELAAYLRTGALPKASQPPDGSERLLAELADDGDDTAPEASAMGTPLAPRSYTPMPLAQGAQLLSVGRPHPYVRAFHDKTAVYTLGLAVARPLDGAPPLPAAPSLEQCLDGDLGDLDQTLCHLMEVLASESGRTPTFRVSCFVSYGKLCRAVARREQSAAEAERELADSIVEASESATGETDTDLAALVEAVKAGYAIRAPAPLDVGCLPLAVVVEESGNIQRSSGDSETTLTCQLQVSHSSSKEAWLAAQEALVARAEEEKENAHGAKALRGSRKGKAAAKAKGGASSETKGTSGGGQVAKKPATLSGNQAFGLGYARTRKAIIRRIGDTATRERWLPLLMITSGEEQLEQSLAQLPPMMPSPPPKEGDRAVVGTADDRNGAPSATDATADALLHVEQWFLQSFELDTACRSTPTNALVHVPRVDRCDICRSDEEIDRSVIVQCAGCLLTVHTECYHIDISAYAMGSRPWLCEVCENRSRIPVSYARSTVGTLRDPPCALCPSIGGAYKVVCRASSESCARALAGKSATARRSEMFYKTRYVHSVCALYMPEVSFERNTKEEEEKQHATNPPTHDQIAKGNEPAPHIPPPLPATLDGMAPNVHVREELHGIEKVNKQRRELRCVVCQPEKRNDGDAADWPPAFPVVQCSFKKCYLGMHPLCAINHAEFAAEYVCARDVKVLQDCGVLGGESITRLEDGSCFVTMCRKHAPAFKTEMAKIHSADKTPATLPSKDQHSVEEMTKQLGGSLRDAPAAPDSQITAPTSKSARVLSPRDPIPPVPHGAPKPSPVSYLVGPCATRRKRLQSHLASMASPILATSSCLIPASNSMAHDWNALRGLGPQLGGPSTLANTPRLELCQSLHASRITLVRSSIHGNGLACKVAVRRGELVVEYVGQLVRKSVSDLREFRSYDASNCVGASGTYVFGLPRSSYAESAHVDATFCGNAARLANHSCEPNCSSRIVDVGENSCRVALFALRDIAAFEELTYDYRMSSEAIDLVCRCGAPSCRGTVNVK